jgi:adenine phosphoribosyltransferase
VNPAINPYRSLEEALTTAIQDFPDFPTEGIVFKDLSPVWANPVLRAEAVKAVSEWILASGILPTAIAGIESRGFLLGMSLADRLGLPFIAFRKEGKLPGSTVGQSYALEYGEAVLECQVDAFRPEDRVLIHDDVLATGGTAGAAASLVERSGAVLWGFSFLMSLNSLNGRERLQAKRPEARLHSLLSV